MQSKHAMREKLVYPWCCLALIVGMAGSAAAHASDPFTSPTPEEMAMTSVPGYPGAPAVVLFDEEIYKDDMHTVTHYVRVKILTEEGKKYANVDATFGRARGDYLLVGNYTTLLEVAGRTIHADGTIIPFTGKPYLKTVVKEEGERYQTMVFTLPDVEVGSIIECRYTTRDEYWVYPPPNWIIQGDLYVKSAHYQWFPTARGLINLHEDKMIYAVSWFSILPEGATIKRILPASKDRLITVNNYYDLTLHDIPPLAKEEHMPPLANFGYRVMFNYTAYNSPAEYWKGEGKFWSKETDTFIGPNGDLKNATQDVIAGATTQDEKLRKIYAAVMQLENTNYTRVHDAKENKAEGGEKIDNADQILKHKRGSPNDLTMLFVGMARAAGLEAYAMRIPDRSRHFFVEQWLNMEQLDGAIAIVNVDGKEQYFDPGSRYCGYGHLDWRHTLVKGLRQTAAGTEFAQTPGDSFQANTTKRVANLTMDEHGQLTGKIDLEFSGAAALGWRQRALRGDEESLRQALEQNLRAMVPKSVEVKVAEIKDLDEYEKPLAVSFDVTGTMGTPTGKRLVMPVDLFTAGETATFPQEKRDTAIYFNYPETVQDALRVNFAEGFAVEATPADGKFTLPSRALYAMNTTSAPTSFTTRRTFVIGDFVFVPTEYSMLRGFYSQFEAKDQESVVLKTATAAAASAPAAN